MSIPPFDGRFLRTAVVLTVIAIPLACAVTCDDGRDPARERAMADLKGNFREQVLDVHETLRRLRPGDTAGARAALATQPTYGMEVAGDVVVHQIAHGSGRHGEKADRHRTYSWVMACYRVTGRPGHGVTAVPESIPCSRPLPQWAKDCDEVSIPADELPRWDCPGRLATAPAPSHCGG